MPGSSQFKSKAVQVNFFGLKGVGLDILDNCKPETGFDLDWPANDDHDLLEISIYFELLTCDHCLKVAID